MNGNTIVGGGFHAAPRFLMTVIRNKIDSSTRIMVTSLLIDMSSCQTICIFEFISSAGGHGNPPLQNDVSFQDRIIRNEAEYRDIWIYRHQRAQMGSRPVSHGMTRFSNSDNENPRHTLSPRFSISTRCLYHLRGDLRSPALATLLWFIRLSNLAYHSVSL